MKRHLCLIAAIMLVAGLIVCAYRGPSMAADVKPIKITVALPVPEPAWLVQKAIKPWCDQVTEATQGRVQFDMYYSSTLCNLNEVWQVVLNGVADMGFIVHSLYPGLTPIGDVVTLPFLNLDTAKKNSTVFWKMYEKFPEIRNEFKPQHVLATWCSEPTHIGTVKKQIKIMEDIKGLKLKSGGGLPVTSAFKLMGAIPVSMPATDTYMNLQKNVIDGTTSNHETLISFKWYEVLKYITHAPIYAGSFSLVMNNAKWNSLPKDIQDAINSVSGLSASQFIGYNEFDAVGSALREKAKKEGYTIEEYWMPQSEVDKMIAIAGKPAWEGWVKKMESSGHSNAREILNTLLELQKTYK